MPIRVAVAGVTNALGHAIVSNLLRDADIRVILFTRKSSADTHDLSHFTSQGAELHPTDYTSVSELTSALAGVETVIVTLFSHNDITPTVNLIEASKAAGVKRFAPAEFTFTSKANARIELFEPKRRIWEKLKQSGLEYTAFQNGLFADHFVTGAPKDYRGPLKKLDHLIIDIPAGKATIPGTGDEPISFSSYRDVGRFVAGAVKLKDKWPEELSMCSETTTYNEIVHHVEAVTGKKMDVEYIDKAAIRKMLDDKSNPMKHFYAQLLDLIADGLGAVPPVLNNMLPDNLAGNVVQGVIAEHWRA